MRTLLSSGAILLVLVGPALARGATQADNRASSHPDVELAQQMPSQGGMGQGQSGGGPMTMNPEMMQHMQEMMRHMRQNRENEEDEHEHERSRQGAFVRFKRGDVEVDIRCPTNQSMRDCVADATTLVDKLAALPSQPSPSR